MESRYKGRIPSKLNRAMVLRAQSLVSAALVAALILFPLGTVSLTSLLTVFRVVCIIQPLWALFYTLSLKRHIRVLASCTVMSTETCLAVVYMAS